MESEGDKPIIHADFLPAEIDANYHPEVELIGDLAHTLWMLNERLDDHGAPEFDLSYQREIRAEMTAEFGWVGLNRRDRSNHLPLQDPRQAR